MNLTSSNRSETGGQTIRSLIDDRANSDPDAPFLIDPVSGEQLTYGSLGIQCRNFAQHLQASGLNKGDCIAYAMQNGLDAARVILGSFYGGYLTAAINLVSGSRTIDYVIGHSGAKLVFGTENTLKTIEGAISDSQRTELRIVTDDVFAQQTDRNDHATEPLRADDSALVMYTSGTTGTPKGVVHTHQSLLAGAGNTVLAHQLTKNDRALCVLPLYHINGLCVTLLGPLVSGGSVVVPNRFSASNFWATIVQNQCNWFSVVPTQISYLLHNKTAADTGNVRFGRSASAPLAPEVQEAFESRFGIPVIETMGLTETAAQILSNPLPPAKRKIGSPGIPFGNQVIIADNNQSEVPRGQEGEVLVKGPNVMREYRANEAATTAALTADGWLRTGDLGCMDEDGFVFITGRLKELIIKGGENIAPREIDEALYAHPDVIEAAAFARSCEQYGQKVEAAVMVRDGSALTEESLKSLCSEKIGLFKSPDRIYFLPELPKGPSGKIQRLQLAHMTG